MLKGLFLGTLHDWIDLRQYSSISVLAGPPGLTEVVCADSRLKALLSPVKGHQKNTRILHKDMKGKTTLLEVLCKIGDRPVPSNLWRLWENANCWEEFYCEIVHAFSVVNHSGEINKYSMVESS